MTNQSRPGTLKQCVAHYFGSLVALNLPPSSSDDVTSNAMSNTTKMLLVFCDGTGMDGTLADDSSPGQHPPQRRVLFREELSCI